MKKEFPIEPFKPALSEVPVQKDGLILPNSMAKAIDEAIPSQNLALPQEGSISRFAKGPIIADFHNDLLSYVADDPKNSIHDTITGSSLAQIQEGNIAFLALAVFKPTEINSETAFLDQKKIFTQVQPVFSSKDIKVTLCVENGSSLIGENEDLDDAFFRLKNLIPQEKLLYVSLTWNSENRFGGGAFSQTGLKSDGKRLLDFLRDYAFAIDVSHASDQLCQDIFVYLDETKSPLRVLASHSNFRSVRNVPRNIPDELAQEVVARNGIIGLTCIKNFIGESFEDYFAHIDHAIRLGLQDGIAIGADFFYPKQTPKEIYPLFLEEHYFPGMESLATLPSMLEIVKKRFGEELCQKFMWGNGLLRGFCS